MRTVQAWMPSPAGQPVPAGAAAPRHWYVVGPADHPAAAALPAPAAGGRAGAGTAVLLGPVFTDADNARLVEGVRAAVRRGGRLVLLHLGAGGASLVRAATGENRALRALSVELAPRPSAAALRTAAALVTGDLAGPEELRVDQDGKLTGQRWRRVTLPGPAPGGLGPGLAIITGGLGGLGIRAAAVLAAREGLHPVLVDRRDPAALPPASQHHLRLLAAGPTGVTVRRADLSRPGPAAAALRDLPGRPVVLVHAAGVMCHGPASRYQPDELAAAQAVKVAALAHTLPAIDPGRLRSVVVFGSVLAEQPPHGLGGYGLANEVLRRAVPRLTAGLTGTATVVAQWSIWAGAGMAHDLAVTPQARAMGLTPISLRPGLEALRRLAGGAVHGPLVLLGAAGDGNAEEGATPGPAYRRPGWGGVG